MSSDSTSSGSGMSDYAMNSRFTRSNALSANAGGVLFTSLPNPPPRANRLPRANASSAAGTRPVEQDSQSNHETTGGQNEERKEGDPPNNQLRQDDPNRRVPPSVLPSSDPPRQGDNDNAARNVAAALENINAWMAKYGPQLTTVVQQVNALTPRVDQAIAAANASVSEGHGRA